MTDANIEKFGVDADDLIITPPKRKPKDDAEPKRPKQDEPKKDAKER